MSLEHAGRGFLQKAKNRFIRSRSTGLLSKAKTPCANDKLDTTYSAGQLVAAFGFLWATFGFMKLI